MQSPRVELPKRLERTESGELILTFTRFEFMAAFAALATPLIVGGAAASNIVERLEEQGLQDRLLQESTRNTRSYLSTVIESTLMWVGAMKMTDILEYCRIHHGTKATYDLEEYIPSHAALVKENLWTCVLVPVIEEVLFRVIPSSILKNPDDLKTHWEVGLPSNLAFALIHNVGRNDEGYFVSLNSIPLEQLILGAYCWYAMRAGGGRHAALAHVLYNTLCGLHEAREYHARDHGLNDEGK